MTSTGTAGNTSKTLVADVQGINGVLDYEYYSTYETRRLVRHQLRRNPGAPCRSSAHGQHRANTSNVACR